MTTTYKILGQVAPFVPSGTTSTGWTTIYTVPTGKQAIVTNILAGLTTIGQQSTPFSLSLVPNGQTANNTSTSIGCFYYVQAGGNDPNQSLNFDLCMSEGDSIQVMYNSATRAVGDPRYPTTFTAMGTEITP